MDILELQKKRYTVRDFSKQKLEEEKLLKILEAGRWSPTAVNYQPQRILVLDSEESLQKVKGICTFEKDEYYRSIAEECIEGDKNNYYYGAPTVLMVCFDKDIAWKHPQTKESSGLIDTTIITTHMMLEATALGVGSAWVSYFDQAKAKIVFGLPDNIEPVVLLLLGYPSKDSKPNNKLSGKRYSLSKTVFHNQYAKESD